MNPDKIILHRLDSPSSWDWEQSERTHSRRRTLNIVAAVTAVCTMTAMLYRPDTVEDYSLRSASQTTTVQHSESTYLADVRGN